MQAYILLFNTSSAFAAERVLRSPLLSEFDFQMSLVPTPKEFLSDCGMSLLIVGGERLNDEELQIFWQSVESILQSKKIHYRIQCIV